MRSLSRCCSTDPWLRTLVVLFVHDFEVLLYLVWIIVVIRVAYRSCIHWSGYEGQWVTQELDGVPLQSTFITRIWSTIRNDYLILRYDYITPICLTSIFVVSNLCWMHAMNYFILRISFDHALYLEGKVWPLTQTVHNVRPSTYLVASNWE